MKQRPDDKEKRARRIYTGKKKDQQHRENKQKKQEAQTK